MKAVVAHEYGGPEVLKYEDVPVPDSKDNEILVRVIASKIEKTPTPTQLRTRFVPDARAHRPKSNIKHLTSNIGSFFRFGHHFLGGLEADFRMRAVGKGFLG